MSSDDEKNLSEETLQGDGDHSSVGNKVDDVLDNFKNLRVSLNEKLDRFEVLLSDIPKESRKLCETLRNSEHTKQEVDLANKVVEWSRLLTNHSTPCQFSPCGGKKCKLCKGQYVKPTHFVRSKAGKVFTIQTNMNCNSKNLIYLMTCSDCGMQYVGQTGDPLKTRMNKHRSDSKTKAESKNNAKEESRKEKVKNKKTKNENWEVDEHFALDDHEPQVYGIVKMDDDASEYFRKAVESYLMQPEYFDTLGENGLNKNVSNKAILKKQKETEAERKERTELIESILSILDGFIETVEEATA